MSATGLIKKTSHAIDLINIALGRCMSWLTFVMAIVVLGLVLSRNIFNVGSIAVQESVIYMHAAVFLLCLAYTAHANGHVRVDIFYRRFNRYQRAWIDITGHILLLTPFAIFLVIISWNYVLKSWGWQPSSGAWGVREGSGNSGGLEATFLLKSLIPLTGILLLLHAISDTLKNLLTLCKDEPQETQRRVNNVKELDLSISDTCISDTSTSASINTKNTDTPQ